MPNQPGNNAALKSIETKLKEDFELVKTVPFGTRFYKADLHFHTPASTDARGSDKYGFNPYTRKYPPKTDKTNPDYDYAVAVRDFHYDILKASRLKAREIVWRFCQQGLSLVAVTDHNGIGTIWADEQGRMDLAAPTWYELLEEAAQKVNNGLTILPGVEVSTTGVHILAIFPPQEPRRKVHFMICDLLNEVGIGPDDWGKNPKLGHASVYDTVELILKKGGLAIPAHIDGSDQAVLELYEVDSPSMRQLLQNEHLRAVEIVDPNKLNALVKGESMTLTRKAWIDKARREAGLSSLAYFQGSDAHDLRTIGKRFTYLKMTEPSFPGLQTAMKSPSSRVRIRDSKKEWSGLYIRGMVFDHPILGKQTLRFNRNLNCISGKMGTGKTSLYNLMQAAVYPEYPQRDAEGQLKKDADGVPFTFMGYEKDESEKIKRDGEGNPIPCQGSVAVFVDLVKQIHKEPDGAEKLPSDLDLLASAKLVKENDQGVIESKLISDRELIDLVKQFDEYKESVSEHYAYCRDAGQESVSVFCLEAEGETYQASNLAQIKVREKLPEEQGPAFVFEPAQYAGVEMKKFIDPLRPKFYNARGMNDIIFDRSGIKLQDFLCKHFGMFQGALNQDRIRKNQENIAAFNDLFFVPRFLDAEKQTELVRARADKAGLEDEIARIEEELAIRKNSLAEEDRKWLDEQLTKKKREMEEIGKSIVELEKDQFQLEAKDFKDKKADQFLWLALTAENTLKLQMNIDWRQGASEPCMVDFLDLTPSQRKIAMIAMIIVNGQLPVIIDAPEDEFDNGDMARYLLPLILEYKDTRQILLFSNQPLLAVNTDPDNYLLLWRDVDQKSKFVSGFAIDAQVKRDKDGNPIKNDRKTLLLEILEGDLAAFRRRASRYE